METEHIEIVRVADAARSTCRDTVVREVEVVIELDGRVRRRLLCLPGQVEELALGHLAARGIAASDIAVEPAEGRLLARARRVGRIRAGQALSSLTVTEGQVFDAVALLEENCPLYKTTGGTHVAGMLHGADAVFVEDVSRHCAIDKVLGAAMKRGIPPSESILVASCRQTRSTMSKAVRMGVPIVITVSAPTDQAIRHADRAGITLIGFARGRQFNVYCHPWRVAPGSE